MKLHYFCLQKKYIFKKVIFVWIMLIGGDFSLFFEHDIGSKTKCDDVFQALTFQQYLLDSAKMNLPEDYSLDKSVDHNYFRIFLKTLS